MTEFKELIDNNMKVMQSNKWFGPAVLLACIASLAWAASNIYIYFSMKKMDKIDEEIKALEEEVGEV